MKKNIEYYKLKLKIEEFINVTFKNDIYFLLDKLYEEDIHLTLEEKKLIE